MPQAAQKLHYLQSFEAALEAEIRRLYFDCLALRLGRISCTFLRSLDLLICLEGVCSPAEQMLQQSNAQLAQSMGEHIGLIMKNRLHSAIERRLSLSVRQINFLEPRSADCLNLLVTLNLQSL